MEKYQYVCFELLDQRVYHHPDDSLWDYEVTVPEPVCADISRFI